MSEPKEQALADVRDALASLNSVPGAPLDEQKHELLREAAENVGALERALTNEVEQKDADDEMVVTDGGLYEKYEVYKDGGPVEDCFVLEPEDDSAALEALIRYAEETDDEELAEDLREWVTEICTRGESP